MAEDIFSGLGGNEGASPDIFAGLEGPDVFAGLEEKPSKLKKIAGKIQKAAQIIDTPARGIRGLVVGAEQLGEAAFTDKTASQALERASEATKVGYRPQGAGEHIASFVAGVGDPLGLGVMGAARKMAIRKGLGMLATGAIEGAAGGVAGTGVTELSETGEVSPANLALGAGLGAGLGAAGEKIGSMLAKRAATKQATQDAAKASAKAVEEIETRLTNAEFLRNHWKRIKTRLEEPFQNRIGEIESRLKEIESEFPAASYRASQESGGEIATARQRINEFRVEKNKQAPAARAGDKTAQAEMSRLDGLIKQEQNRISAIELPGRAKTPTPAPEGMPRSSEQAQVGVEFEKLSRQETIYAKAASEFEASQEGKVLSALESELRKRKAASPDFIAGKPAADELQRLRSLRTQRIVEAAEKLGETFDEKQVATLRLKAAERAVDTTIDAATMSKTPSPQELALSREAKTLREEMRMRYRMLSQIEASPVGKAYKKFEGMASDFRTQLRGKNAIGKTNITHFQPETPINAPGSIPPAPGAKGRPASEVAPEAPSRAAQATPEQAELPGLDDPAKAQETFLPGFQSATEMAKKPPEVPTVGGGISIDPVPVMAQATENIREAGKQWLKAWDDNNLDAVLAVGDYASGRKRLNKALAQFVRAGGENAKRIVLSMDVEDRPILEKLSHLPPAKFADELEATATEGGRMLQALSQIAKQVGKIADVVSESGDETLKNALDKTIGKGGRRAIASFIDPVAGFGRDMIDAWRGYLVATYGTAARNVMTQTGRFGVQMVDDAVNGAVQRWYYGIPAKKAFASLDADWFSLVHMLSSRKYRKGIESLAKSLESMGADAISANPLSDVNFKARTKLGGYLTSSARILNEKVFGNIAQEQFFRRMAMDARLRTTLSRAGFMDNIAGDLSAAMSKLPPQTIEQFVQDAAQHALTLTFGASPRKGTAASAILNVYHKLPILHVLSTPFPRFWYNAMKFTMDYSPLGYAFNRYGGHVNKELAASGMSKAFTGTMLWSAAIAMRASKYAGEKWYEVRPDPDKNPGRVLDMRAFNPFATSMFLAEAMKRRIEMGSGARLDMGFAADEIANALIALRRSDFAGIPLLDNTIFNKSEVTESSGKMLEAIGKLTGDFLGGFTVPVKSFRDIIGGMEPMNVKSVQQSPLTGPLLSNIPGAREALPNEPTPTREGPRQYEYPIAKQAGFAIQNKSPFEQELDKHDISRTQLAARLGDPDLNDAATARIGQLLEPIMNTLVETSAYKSLDRYDPKFIMEKFISAIRPSALKMGQMDVAEIWIPMKIQSILDKNLPLPERQKARAITNEMIRNAKGRRLP